MKRAWVTAILVAGATAIGVMGEWPLCAAVLAVTVIYLITTEGA